MASIRPLLFSCAEQFGAFSCCRRPVEGLVPTPVTFWRGARDAVRALLLQTGLRCIAICAPQSPPCNHFIDSRRPNPSAQLQHCPWFVTNNHEHQHTVLTCTQKANLQKDNARFTNDLAAGKKRGEARMTACRQVTGSGHSTQAIETYVGACRIYRNDSRLRTISPPARCLTRKATVYTASQQRQTLFKARNA
jgi:hypothetical protein